MNEPSSALRVAAIEVAARAIELPKLQVVGRGWRSGHADEPGEATAVVTPRVAAALELAALRQAGTPWRVNAEVPRDELLRRFMPHGGGSEPIERATDIGLASDFAAADSLRVAWTFADLNGLSSPTRGDCTAALGLRMGETR